jgi:hypothetical protein
MIITFGFGSVEIGTDGSTVVDLPGIGVNVGNGGTNISFGNSVIDVSDAGTVIDIPGFVTTAAKTPATKAQTYDFVGGSVSILPNGGDIKFPGGSVSYGSKGVAIDIPGIFSGLF